MLGPADLSSTLGWMLLLDLHDRVRVADVSLGAGIQHALDESPVLAHVVGQEIGGGLVVDGAVLPEDRRLEVDVRLGRVELRRVQDASTLRMLDCMTAVPICRWRRR